MGDIRQADHDHNVSPMPFGMKAVEAVPVYSQPMVERLWVTNAFRHEGR